MSSIIAGEIRQAVPIKCAQGSKPYSVSFLKILVDGERLRVMPTSLGKKKLPRFWMVWLEELILKKTRPAQQFHVSIDNHHVLVGAESITPEGLFATVSQLAAQIYPLKFLPLEGRPQHSSHIGEGSAYYWRPRLDGIRFDIDAIQVHLPQGATISIDQFSDDKTGREVIKLLCRKSLPTPQHTKLWVEYYTATHPSVWGQPHYTTP